MIPVGDVIPSRTRPLVTLSVAAIIIVIAVAIRLFAGDRIPDLLLATAVVPAEFSLWRSVTAAFIHIDWLTVTVNIALLLVLGRTLEDRLGHDRFALLFLLGCLAGAVAASWTSTANYSLVVGGGAAIGALAGAYMALFPRSRVLMLLWLPFLSDAVEIPAIVLVAVWGLCQVIAAANAFAPPGTGGTPALWNVLGGLVMGAGVAHLLVRRDRLRVEWWS